MDPSQRSSLRKTSRVFGATIRSRLDAVASRFPVYGALVEAQHTVQCCSNTAVPEKPYMVLDCCLLSQCCCVVSSGSWFHLTTTHSVVRLLNNHGSSHVHLSVRTDFLFILDTVRDARGRKFEWVNDSCVQNFYKFSSNGKVYENFLTKIASIFPS